MTRRLLTASAAAALALGLAACGDDTGGTITDPPATVAVDTSDNGGDQPSDGGGSTEAAPDIPAPDPADYPGMDKETDEGAEQAFKFYFDTLFWGYQSGLSGPLDGLASSECSTCADASAEVDSYKESGRYWSEVQNEEVKLESNRADNDIVEVDYGFVVPPHTEPSSDSNDSRADIPKTIYGASGAIKWIDGAWQIQDMALSGEYAD